MSGKSEQSSLTSKLLLPVAGDLAALGLDGLLAVGSCACSFPGAESTVPFVGYTHAPLPLPTVRLALLLSCRTKRTPALCNLPMLSPQIKLETELYRCATCHNTRRKRAAKHALSF